MQCLFFGYLNVLNKCYYKIKIEENHYDKVNSVFKIQYSGNYITF